MSRFKPQRTVWPQCTLSSRDGEVMLRKTLPSLDLRFTQCRHSSQFSTPMDSRRTSEWLRRVRRSVRCTLITGALFQVSQGVNGVSDQTLTCVRKGDPTDTSIKLRPLEPASGQALARDLVLKTRRRKGLSDSIAVSKYLEDEVCLVATLSKISLLIAFKCRRPSLRSALVAMQICWVRHVDETARLQLAVD